MFRLIFLLLCLPLKASVFIHGEIDFSLMGKTFVKVLGNLCIESLGCDNKTDTIPQEDNEMNTTSKNDMHVEIYLFTNQDGPQTPNFTFKDVSNISSINASSFNFTQETKIIIPGWQSKSNSTWIKEMVKELLIYDDYNVFVVSWADYITNIFYTMAVRDSRKVGDKVAHFIHLLNKNYRYPLEYIHLIGHSLGAHISGHVGAKLKGQLKRISGLDPAGPLFDGQDPNKRLDPSDAKFVDVIHSNAGTLAQTNFGIKQNIGHVDFYPNGGSFQPGCPSAKGLFKELFSYINSRSANNSITIGCHHKMAIDYFVESINSNCSFGSMQCRNFTDFLNDNCGECTDTKCVNMGFHARWPTSHSAPLSFFLVTAKNKPYCLNYSSTL